MPVVAEPAVAAMPRITTVVPPVDWAAPDAPPPPGPPGRRLTPGAMREMSVMSLISRASRLAWLTAVMLIGTDRMFSVRFCAVTTTSSSIPDDSEAPVDEASAARAPAGRKMRNAAAADAHSRTRKMSDGFFMQGIPKETCARMPYRLTIRRYCAFYHSMTGANAASNADCPPGGECAAVAAERQDGGSM